jgi:uncharacterized protein (DUF1800 family)
MEIRELQHIARRACFGMFYKDIKPLCNLSKSEFIDKIFEDSKYYSPLYFKDIAGIDDLKKEMTKEDKKEIKQKSRQDLKDLNILWIDKMINDKAQLTEKMTLFWHGHFACRSPIAEFVLNQNNLIRKNSLGSFRDLVHNISKDPAMLQFLNNQQNTKDHPNENFARELMELFTLGRGNYTEDDIKESARAFTGWGFNKQGEFIIRKYSHDTGKKTFRGKTGNFNGNDIIDMILDDKKCAEFITGKLYKYFINENPDEDFVKEASDVFYRNDYNIEKLLRVIFSSDNMLNEVNTGIRIKSPVEFIVELIKVLNLNFENPEVILVLEKSLNQILFNPPNVAGWAGGKKWIDTSTLLFRMRLPEMIFIGSELEFSYKNTDDTMDMGNKVYKERKDKISRSIKSKISLKEITDDLGKLPQNEILVSLISYLLPVEINDKISIISAILDTSSNENYIESAILQIMSLPEYQLS